MSNIENYIELPLAFREVNSKELCEALDSEPSTSIRLNPNKSFQSEWQDKVDWCNSGRYLDSRPQFTLDPLFAAGAYYVQEASSMMSGEVARRIFEDLGESSPLVVDLCAAPGGKSTHLMSVVAEYSEGRGVVVANEVIKQRAGILAQNVVKWGEGNGVVTSSDVKFLGKALSGRVDLLVVDAPCSGEGMFRKDMEARKEWSLESVELCAARQKRILSDASQMLKSGGYLIYSTCTFNSQEDEGVVKWLVESGEFELCQEYLNEYGEVGEYGSHFLPHQVKGEGFFISVLQYVGDNDSEQFDYERENKKSKKGKKSGTSLKKSSYSTLPIFDIEDNGKVYGYSELMIKVVEWLRSSKIYILMSGIEFGELIRGELKPSHNYALYSHSIDSINKTEVGLETAQEYLRKGTLQPNDFTEGLQLVTYHGQGLGFIKRIGNRLNNNYPTAWRIINL